MSSAEVGSSSTQSAASARACGRRRCAGAGRRRIRNFSPVTTSGGTGERAGRRSCGGATCTHIRLSNTLITIMNALKYASMSNTRASAKFRCQFPASPVLANKIPLLATSTKSHQGVCFVRFFAGCGHFWDTETGYFPAIREEACYVARGARSKAAAIRARV